MKNNRFKGVITLVVVTIISFAIIIVSKLALKEETSDNDKKSAVGGSIDIGEEEGIVSAGELLDDNGNVAGYVVTAKAKGFVGDITWDVIFDTDGKTITDVSVVSHTESEGYGSKMEDDEFLKQFIGIEAPVYLRGNAPINDDSQSEESTQVSGGLVDGIYYLEDEEVVGNFKNYLTLKVEGGVITSLVWDCKDEVGEYKSYLSSVGKYVMTEDGLTWKEQADALAQVVLEDQSTQGILLDEEGKTDSVSGVSIDISDFINLTEKALEQASSGQGAVKADSDNILASNGSATELDGISSATATSEAIIELVNRAYNFISQYLAM